MTLLSMGKYSWFLTLLCNTDVPGSGCDHNDNRCHADAPFSCGLYVWVLGRVRHSPHMFSSAHYSRHRFSTHEVFQTSGLKFSKTQPIRTTPIPLNPMEITVHTVFEQHPSPQVGDHSSSINTDEEVYETLNRSNLDEEVGLGE